MLYALYDVLDSEESEYDKAENGGIAAEVTVYGNRSGFTLSVSEQPPATVLTVAGGCSDTDSVNPLLFP